MTMKLKNEDLQQYHVVQQLKRLKQLGMVIEFWSTPNEVKVQSKQKSFNIYSGQKLKTLGKKAGVADLQIVFSNFTLFIEMKDAPRILKSGKESVTHTSVSDAQTEFISTMNTTNHNVAFVCYGAKQASLVIKRGLEVNKKMDNQKNARSFFG